MSHVLKLDCWIMVYPADDQSGDWMGECPNLNVITWGSSPEHAFEMVLDAATETILDDLELGHDTTKRSAPQETWARLTEILERGSPVASKEDAAKALTKAGSGMMAVKMQCFVEEVGNRSAAEPRIHPANQVRVAGVLAAA